LGSHFRIPLAKRVRQDGPFGRVRSPSVSQSWNIGIVGGVSHP
jgi:hypothetical protein